MGIREQADNQRNLLEKVNDVISERTPIRLGLIVVLVTACLGLSGGAVTGIWWWASWSSRIETKLSSIEVMLATITTANTRTTERVDDLDRRLLKMETAGPPAMQQVTKEVNELMKQFELHKFRDTRP